MARNALTHSAVWINRGSDPIIGVAQNPAAVLDSPHPGHIQVLPGRAGIAVPAIVADIHQHFSAIARKLANLVAKDRFIADEDTVPMTSRAISRAIPGAVIDEEGLAIFSGTHVREVLSELMREEEQLAKRD